MFLRIGTFFLLAASLLLAQTPKPGSADGIVTNSVTGQPVKRALVKFSGGRRVVGCSAVTDSAGRFHCDSIPPGRYRVTADAEGYAAPAYARKIVAIAAEQTASEIALTLVPLGVITGRITDDSGQPIAGAAIVAQNAARLFWGGGAMSDDRGRYRINLQPGRYYLKVSMLPGDETGSAPHPNLHHLSQQQMYPETYYPNAASLDAAVAQRVDPGAELTADFRLPKLPAYHIRGRLTGAVERGMTVSMAPCSEPEQSTGDDDDGTFAISGSVAFFAPTARPVGLAASNGDFDIGGMVKGEYCLTARASRIVPGPRVKVNQADTNGVEFAIPATFTVDGSLTGEDGPVSDTMGLSIQLAGPSGAVHANDFKANGTFSLAGVTPDAYRIRVASPPDFYVKSMRYGSDEIPGGKIASASPGVPLRIILGKDPATLTVKVSYGDIDPLSIVQLTAIPDGPLASRGDLRRYGALDGNDTVTWVGLAPGTYRVVAFESANFNDSQDRALVRALASQSKPIELHGAEHASQTIAVIPGAEVEKTREKLR